jgi:hypothetical protein
MPKSKLTRFLTTRFKLILKRVGGVLLFVLFASIEVSDWLSLMAAFGNRSGSNRTAGLNPEFITIYLVILTILSIAIVFIACGTIVGLITSAAWTIRTAHFTAICFALYGGFQIFSAFYNPGMVFWKVSMAGITFILVGAALYGLGTSVVKA